jgi:hypothetical protein
MLLCSLIEKLQLILKCHMIKSHFVESQQGNIFCVLIVTEFRFMLMHGGLPHIMSDMGSFHLSCHTIWLWCASCFCNFLIPISSGYLHFMDSPLTGIESSKISHLGGMFSAELSKWNNAKLHVSKLTTSKKCCWYLWLDWEITCSQWFLIGCT